MQASGILTGRTRATLAAVLLLLVVVLVALSGGATSGRASSAPGVAITSFTVLNDDTLNTVPGQPTPGGNIGYSVTVENNGTSTANHLSLTETIGSTGALVYVDASGISCGAVTSPPQSTLSCQITKLDPGASFTVTALFRTDSSALPGTDVTNTGLLAFDSQTNGQSNNKTVSFGQDQPRTLAGGTDNALSESITLHGDHLAAPGGGQFSDLTMPAGFLNNHPFVGASLQNIGGPNSQCAACAPFQTVITITTASSFSALGPFWDGTTAAPFAWSLTLPGSLVPKGFKLTGVYHDGTLLQMCSATPSPLTFAPGICVATLNQARNTKTITATGLAVSNGTYQFG
jgi:uncharacterized repeat protein (TIGR01451 family)